jgi:ABC-type sugar transport system permease subunit
MATLIILAIRTNWNVVEFGLPFEMLAGGPGTRTTFLSILLYKLGFVRLELGRAYVVGVAMILISLTAFFLYTKILRGAMGEEE